MHTTSQPILSVINILLPASSLRELMFQTAPAIEDGVVEYYDTDFENEFAHKTKYRGPPTPELEAAWDQIWNRTLIVLSLHGHGMSKANTSNGPVGGVEVPLDGPARLGKASKNLVHIHSDEARGYSGMLEVFHQLHCLVRTFYSSALLIIPYTNHPHQSRLPC